MRSIYSITRKKLEDYFLNNGDKKFRATQIFEWVYRKKIKSFDEISNINKNAISKIKEDFYFNSLKIVRKQEDEGVKKYLFSLSDGNKIESVVMYHDYGISICISSQIGCNMGCAFCESGRLKKVRNLTVDEMLLQVLQAEDDINDRISHIVVMGIGEPFDNYDNVIDFINIANDAYALAIGIRHITVSTSGIVPKINKFAKDCSGVNLAVSLHAPNNEIRDKIMKVNKAYNIEELIESVKNYIKITNRRVTFEYIMLKGINDTETNAYELAKVLKGINCYVNIIPYNETNNIGFKRSNTSQITRFCGILKEENINVTIRREFGSKVSAACGQLRSEN
ncbi:MAG: 23S rRNA (adenine(2503)-C(2))-methyltransferase RlmN [Bacilli bacterium]|nr:23S rRNA (adenine(2503)-C(2))-methyltransferase RlmN [Bacilli bacterium]MBP3635313.1 23S rRNA (adenine(2503)-C(2))-methyltransferase RlmN [Bacilli bacterium]